MGLGFDLTQPWVGVFACAARDTKYWGRHVVRPAHTFLARGGNNMSNRSAEDMSQKMQGRLWQGVAGSVGALHAPRSKASQKRVQEQGQPSEQGHKERRRCREDRTSNGEERTPEEVGNPLHHGLRRQRDLLQVREGQGWGLRRTLQSRSGASLSTLLGLSCQRSLPSSYQEEPEPESEDKLNLETSSPVDLNGEWEPLPVQKSRPLGFTQRAEPQSSAIKKKFNFLELYAGFKGFSKAVIEVNGDQVNVLKPLELYDGWDILTPEGLNDARALAKEADRIHVAIPCRSYTKASGTVPTVRSEALGPSCGRRGQQAPCCRRGRLHGGSASRCHHLNRESLGLLPVGDREDEEACKKSTELFPVYIDQCAYGGMFKKPTQTLTNAEWTQAVNLSKLEGKVWDPVTESVVWKTSKLRNIWRASAMHGLRRYGIIFRMVLLGWQCRRPSRRWARTNMCSSDQTRRGPHPGQLALKRRKRPSPQKSSS